MESPNRISQTSLTPTVGRQTPKNDFGDVLANTVAGAVSAGGALASGLSSGSPILSAAVSSIGTVVGTVASGISSIGSTQSAAVGGSLPGVGTAAKGDSWDLLKAQDAQSQKYLALQIDMQRESREFNAVSNILKVRHDSAKAAINNVR
ncbi:MAG: hypothetical protein ACYC8T_03515 [Myxococcaceae bacterium]